MSVLSDNLYLENIEEYVEDDRRIVRYCNDARICGIVDFCRSLING